MYHVLGAAGSAAFATTALYLFCRQLRGEDSHRNLLPFSEGLPDLFHKPTSLCPASLLSRCSPSFCAFPPTTNDPPCQWGSSHCRCGTHICSASSCSLCVSLNAPVPPRFQASSGMGSRKVVVAHDDFCFHTLTVGIVFFPAFSTLSRSETLRLCFCFPLQFPEFYPNAGLSFISTTQFILVECVCVKENIPLFKTL